MAEYPRGRDEAQEFFQQQERAAFERMKAKLSALEEAGGLRRSLEQEVREFDASQRRQVALETYARTYKLLTEAMITARSYDGHFADTEEMDRLTHVRHSLIEDMIRILHPAKEVA